MPIEFRCQSCGRVLRTPDGTEGKKARCPQCGAIEEVPAASNWAGAGGTEPFGGTSSCAPLSSPPAAPPENPVPGGTTDASRNPFADSSSSAPFGPAGGAASPFAGNAYASANPYAAPTASSQQAYTVNRAYAASKVSAPAIGLMMVAIIGILLQTAGAAMNMIGMAQAGPGNGGPPDIPVWIHIVPSMIGIGIGIVILTGAIKMKQLNSYGFAMTASVLAMLPCLSPCCLIGLPIGIWAIVTLNDSNVKAAFQ